MQNLLDNLKKLLQKDERLVSEGELLKNKIIELAIKLDKDLIELLLADKQMKEVFFTEVGKATIFDKDKFIKFVSNKQFLPDSYTAFKNKIGLTEDGDFIREKKEVVLSWPYKDCVLEGGMTKEDQKRDEIFWNEILAPDEITRLLDPKVFTNAKRIDTKGEHKLDKFKIDENGDIKDNLIIKGNNLLALHSLKKRFAGKVKLIYIDPPYNTGNDGFKYNDSFNHSSWLTFMKNRLQEAKNLLKDDGVIFIQCDDNEQAYLKVLMDEIFGRENFVATVPRKTRYSATTQSDAELQKLHDYLIIYWKNKNISQFNLKIIGVKTYPYKDKRGKFYIVPLQDNGPHGTRTARPNLYYPIYQNEKGEFSLEKLSGDDKEFLPSKHQNDDGCWMWSKKKFLTDYKDLFVKNNKVFIKHYYNENEDQNRYQKEKAWLDDYLNTKGTLALKESFGKKGVFNNPKPEELMEFVLRLATKPNDIVLDYHLGSGTTAAVAHKMCRQYIGIEQMDYIDSVSVERLKNVINGDQSGISKSVGWKGGGDFVYLELMKWNENFVEKIQKAKTKDELKKLWETMKEKTFLSYKIDIKAIDANAKDFADLSLENQKRFLLECLDKNHLYVNYSEIDDEEYGVSEADKKLNREFYKS